MKREWVVATLEMGVAGLPFQGGWPARTWGTKRVSLTGRKKPTRGLSPFGNAPGSGTVEKSDGLKGARLAHRRSTGLLRSWCSLRLRPWSKAPFPRDLLDSRKLCELSP